MRDFHFGDGFFVVNSILNIDPFFLLARQEKSPAKFFFFPVEGVYDNTSEQVHDEKGSYDYESDIENGPN